MANIDIGKPSRIFYANLLWSGVQIRVENGSKLFVEDTKDVLSPVYQEEIIKRKAHLVELLTPAPPVELEPYFGRLLKLNELAQALDIAEQGEAAVDATPVNGGWLLTTKKELSRKIHGIA